MRWPKGDFRQEKHEIGEEHQNQEADIERKEEKPEGSRPYPGHPYSPRKTCQKALQILSVISFPSQEAASRMRPIRNGTPAKAPLPGYSNRSGYLDVVPKFGEGMTDIPDVSA